MPADKPYDPQKPVLWGPDGKPLSLEGAMVAPNALNVAAVFQLPGRLYPFRWDEALKDSPQNALAARRDVFMQRLHQERTAPTIAREFQVVAVDEDDPTANLHAAMMNRCWQATYDQIGLKTALSEAVWYGRAAAQVVWGKQEQTGMVGVTFHEPVHGDSVQFSWDNTPAILVSYQTANRYRATDPDAVVPGTDRGAYALRLYSPELRKRFVIHKHVRSAADYFEGEMSGGVHGVGLRSMVYWGYWLRTEVLSWMTSYMQSTGMMDLLVFNYEEGNANAKAQAEANAKQISGKFVLLNPVDIETLRHRGAVEQIPMNAAGMEALRSLVEGWAERHIECVYVGQTMSSGGGGMGGPKSGLEGSGRADFANETKDHLLRMDAFRTAATLDTDWLRPSYAWNFPGATRALKIEPVIEDPRADQKIERGEKCITLGVRIEEAEFRKAAGYREPREGKKVLGEKPAGGGLPGQPGQPGQNPNAPPGVVARPPTETGPDSITADFFERLAHELTRYHAAQPPWPGAVFDEHSHRWKNKDGTEATPDQAKGGRATTSQPQSPEDLAGESAAKAKSLAARLRQFGEKAMGVAKAVATKAHELAYKATAVILEKGLDPGDVLTTPTDEGKLYNDRAINEHVAATLGVPLNGPVLAVVTNVMAYGVTKLKQFIRARLAGKQPAAEEPTGYTLSPELHDGPPEEMRAVKADLWHKMLAALLEQAGLPAELTSSDLVSRWLAGGEAMG